MIDTKRLHLREAQPDDDAFLYELLNSPTWIQYIGDRNISDVAAAQGYLQTALINSYQTNGYGLYVMTKKEDQTAIGICGFVKRPSLPHPDLGFAILPAFEGQGYTTEAALACMDYGKHQLQFDVIMGITSPDNIGSQRVLERAGLRLMPDLSEQLDLKDTLVFSTHSLEL